MTIFGLIIVLLMQSRERRKQLLYVNTMLLKIAQK